MDESFLDMLKQDYTFRWTCIAEDMLINQSINHFISGSMAHKHARPTEKHTQDRQK